ncbi:GNAT family N-acetyltransferase [Oscillibacter ruminantium]|jgi:regulator of nucleoside diphosphate kinase|uniref:GNAT family N-acetyltransferase n=1 Tax=Oscillibacter ruminantium TaxID=1263547 RepID=UPI000315059B|nr:GNAT family protein [Oscillibacter ruminantium]MDN0031486.1 GNAT family protein [Oscillibacter valericigenes]MEA5041853.1 GNAT family protein [Oscillibacter ruminantium]
MKKAASIFLRPEIRTCDVTQLIRWMENPHITRYLNEDEEIADELSAMLREVPEPLLSLQFNRYGRFFLICEDTGPAIGFVKLKEQGTKGCYEIVFAIGEEGLWGNGYGCSAIRAALGTAFLEWRAQKVVAKIRVENKRSINSVRSCGLTCEYRGEKLHYFSTTAEDYLNHLLCG